MNTITIPKRLVLALSLVCTTIFGACSNDDITLKPAEASAYTTAEAGQIYGQLSGGLAITSEAMPIEIVQTASGTLSLHTAIPATEETTLSVAVKPELLETYNKEHKTSYPIFPTDRVSFSANGVLTLSKGATTSSELSLSFSQGDNVTEGVTYVLPIEVAVKSGNSVKLTQSQSQQFVFIRNVTNTKDASKESGIKIFSCIEVNDVNPLNNLSFTLGKSGKPLVDAVILFSSNVNYDEKTGRVYIYHNENVKALLDNREHYLKPLQDKGIKVILSLLGNHDRSGVANLSATTAKAYAQEIKATCDAYQLDGVFFDDEYSNYETPVPAGFVTPSSEAASRLIYEVKQAQPNRLTIAYVYGRTSDLSAVDGVEPGSYLDYALHDYQQGYDLTNSYPGLPKSGMGLYSQEYSQSRFASTTELQRLRDGGYGAHMIFALNPYKDNFQSQLSSMRSIAEILFNDRLVDNGIRYRKDWK